MSPDISNRVVFDQEEPASDHVDVTSTRLTCWPNFNLQPEGLTTQP